MTPGRAATSRGYHLSGTVDAPLAFTPAMTHVPIDPRFVDFDQFEGDIFTCQGCGRYAGHSGTHVRDGEECGEFL